MQELTVPVSDLGPDVVDIDEIVAAYQEKKAVRESVKYLASRERDPRNSETKAENLRWELRQRGNDFTLEEIIGVLELFGNLGCGVYRKGRPREQSRLLWQASARQIAQQVMIQAQAGPEETVQDQETPEIETHYFPVRKGVQQELRLRSDMTAAELDNLADFVKIIAASRRSGEEKR
jgi:hypothetical protein